MTLHTPIRKTLSSSESGIKALGYSIASVVILVFLIFFSLDKIPTQQNNTSTYNVGTKAPQSRVLGTSTAQQRSNSFESIKLQARAGYVQHITTGEVLFSKNASTTHPLASITKIMAGIIALEILPEYTIIPITSEALTQYGDNGLYKDEKWKLTDLLDFSLVSSSNDAISAIAQKTNKTIAKESSPQKQQHIFINKMNEKADTIGLQQTHFSNPHGLDINTYTSGSYSTAKETAQLLAYTFKKYPRLLQKTRHSKISVRSLNEVTHISKNTNAVVNDIPGLLGSKTGYTDLAGGNLAVVFDAGINQPVVAVVLGSTKKGRFTDMLKLLNATYESIGSK